ncbi:MAG: pilus assembly protein PilM [Patescibacteria group bacterium]
MTRSVFSGAFRGFIDVLTRWFPMPKVLLPLTVGVDISGTSIKWIVLSEGVNEKRVLSFGQESISEGIVVNGIVQDVSALAQVLGEMKKKLGGIECAHAALPEEAAYVFSMHVPENSSRKQTLSMIEFELEDRVPIAPADALYDFDVIMKHDDGVGEEIGVVVFPRDLAASYAEAFALAKMRLFSLEVGANSIARAVSNSSANEPVTLLVDFGRLRTSFAVLKRGKPIFTSTVAIGGETIDKAIMQKLSLSREDVTAFKNEQGFLAEGGKISPGVEAISGTVAALADEVARHYQYWDTRRNERGERVTPVERVFLVGGGANLKGLTDYIAARVQVECTRPNVWQNVCSFDDYIPPIDRRASLQYATAIGLALRGI